jgi:hypothetical protein
MTERLGAEEQGYRIEDLDVDDDLARDLDLDLDLDQDLDLEEDLDLDLDDDEDLDDDDEDLDEDEDEDLDDDDEDLDEDEDEDLDDEEDDFMRWSPKWLHRDCASVCLALELGTCCMFPASTLIADLAGLACEMKNAAGEVEFWNDPDPALDELVRQASRAPALFGRVPADLAGLGRNQLFQLICPVGQIAGALAEVCIYGFDEESMPEIAQRRPMLMPVHQLAEELGNRLWAAVRARLGITLADTA